MKFRENFLNASIFFRLYRRYGANVRDRLRDQKNNTFRGWGGSAASAPKLIIELFTLSFWIHGLQTDSLVNSGDPHEMQLQCTCISSESALFVKTKSNLHGRNTSYL